MAYESRKIASGNEEADAFFDRLINCERHGHEADAAGAGDLSNDDQSLLIRFGKLVRRRESLSRKRLEKLWAKAKSEHGREVSPQVEAMAGKYFQSMGSNNRPNLDNFSTSIFTIHEEAFLTPGPNTSAADAYMFREFRTVIAQPPQIHYHASAIDHVPHPTHAFASTSSSTSTSQRRSATTRHRNQETDLQISPMRVASGIIKIVEFALTIAELSSLCTIM